MGRRLVQSKGCFWGAGHDGRYDVLRIRQVDGAGKKEQKRIVPLSSPKKHTPGRDRQPLNGVEKRPEGCLRKALHGCHAPQGTQLIFRKACHQWHLRP
jgi:hypothetical protein